MEMLKYFLRAVVRATAAVAVLLAGAAQAGVKLPNGEYRETVTDLRVKVLGGYVAVERTWIAGKLNKGEYRWYFNPAWADLAFEYDDIDGSVKAIRRADSTFARAGNGVYVFERVFFIARQADGWRWYDRHGNWVRYENNGHIAAYGDRNGVSVRFTRNAHNEIGAVVDHHGTPALTFGYADGKLVTITDRANRKVTYRYEGDALVEVVDVENNRWTYGYTNGLLTRKDDPENRTTTIQYSGNRVVKIVDPRLEATTYDYAYARNRREYTIVEKSPEDRRIERRYDATGGLVREVRGTRETFSLLREGTVSDVEIDERGLRTRTTYDANGNAVRVVSPDGTVATAKYHAAFGVPVERVDRLGVRTLYDYDDRGNLKVLTEAAGTAVERATTFDYDEFGQIRSTTIKGRDDAQGVTVARTYDAFGNVATIAGDDAGVVAMTYDVMGNVLTLTDGRGKTWTTAYDRRGKLTSSKDPLQHETVHEYDRVGNRTKTVDAAGYEAHYTYDESDRVKTVAAPARAQLVYAYDDDGRIRSAGDGTNTIYDGEGRVEKVTTPLGAVTYVYGGSGESHAGLVRRRVSERFCEDYDYDQRGRTTRTVRYTPCEGDERRVETQSIAYDAIGRVVSASDAARRTTLQTYDELGRVRAVTDPAGGTTTFAYDARNNRVGVTTAGGATYRFAYDAADRLIAEVRPSGATIRFKYDAAGNLVERTSASGKRRVFAYDDAGQRIGERRYAAAAGVPEQVIDYAFDARGLLAGYTQSGDTVSRATYTVDGAGARASETLVYGSGAGAFEKTWATTYWPSGRIKRMGYPDGFFADHAYDAGDRLASVTLPDAQTIAWSDYVANVPHRVTMPGAQATLTVDAVHREVRRYVEASGGAGVLDLRDAYNEAGNLATRTLDAANYGYAYDALDRLTQVTAPAGSSADEGFGYDNVHNRKSSVSQPGPWSYDTDNRLLAFGFGSDAMRYGYDDDGNVVTAERGPAGSPASTTENVYDAAERLREVRRDGATIARYQYDPFGRRIRKETANGVTWFQYSGDRLIAELSADGQVRRLYGWDAAKPGAAAPLFVADRAGGAWHYGYFHNDESGTPRKLTDASGAVVWSTNLATFGRATVDSASTVTNPLRFPGQYFDAETGNHYNLNRYYDPSTGRYAETDPVGLAGGVNTYGYAGGNPLRFVDPEGLSYSDIQFVLGQVRRTFGELQPRGGLVCGNLVQPKSGEIITGHTVGLFDFGYPFKTNTMVVSNSWCEKSCLNFDEWKELMNIIFHEAMHSTSGWFADNEEEVSNRDIYEFSDESTRYKGVPPKTIWGKPSPPPGVRFKFLYDEYQQSLGRCCMSSERLGK